MRTIHGKIFNTNRMKKWGALLVCAALLAGLAGCDKREEMTDASAPEDASEQKEGRIVIEMYGSLDAAYFPFFDTLTEKFPEMDLRYEFQWDEAGRVETERRMLHGDGPDIAVVHGDVLASMAEQDLLLDLTGEQFSARYHVSTMTALNSEGRIMGLPLPNDLNCLICNRGVLLEHGITELPGTIQELIEICGRLSEEGQGGIIINDALFTDMLIQTEFLSKPEGYAWLRAYNAGEGSMAGTPAEEAWEILAELAAVSGCSVEDAAALPAKCTSMIMEGKYVFRTTSISNLNYMKNWDPELDIIALPMLGNKEEDQWVFNVASKSLRCIVANRDLNLPENSKKKELVLRILDWISSEEAQKSLAYCSAATITYVDDVKLDQSEITEFLEPAIRAGHLTGTQSFTKNLDEVFKNCAAEILSGTMTPAEAAAACDEQNAAYVPLQEEDGLDEVIGTALEHIYWRKPTAVTVGSSMTQLAAQSMAEAFPEADFAFAMAKNVATSLYPGEITLRDAIACADGEGDRELVLVKATGAQIRDLIDAGVGSPTPATYTAPYGVAGAGRLIHPVGLTYRADITRDKGDKILEITLEDGVLEPEKTYTVIVSGLLVDGVLEPNLDGCPVTPTGKYLRDVLTDYIRAHGEIASPRVNFTIIGAEPRYTLP